MDFINIKSLLGIKPRKDAEEYRLKDGNYIRKGAISCHLGVPYVGHVVICDKTGQRLQTVEVPYSLYNRNIEDVGKSKEFKGVYRKMRK